MAITNRHPHSRRFKQLSNKSYSPTLSNSSRIDVFFYASDYDLAGFVFQFDNASTLRPVDCCQLDSASGETLHDVLNRIQQNIAPENHLGSVIVPKSENGTDEDNYLLRLLPAKYNRRAMQSNPKFSTCIALRGIKLQEGRLDESDFPYMAVLKEQLSQCDENHKPSALLWAYMLGVYELLNTPPMNPDHFYAKH